MSSKCGHQAEEVLKVFVVAPWLFPFLLSILATCGIFPQWKVQTACSNSSLLTHRASPESPISWVDFFSLAKGIDCQERRVMGELGVSHLIVLCSPAVIQAVFLCLATRPEHHTDSLWKLIFPSVFFFLLSIPSLPNLIKDDGEQWKFFHFPCSFEATEAMSISRSPDDLSCVLHVYIHTYVCV